MAKARACLAGGLTAAFVALVGARCSPFGGASAFVCDSDEDCRGALDGRCEPTGFCSFADESCGPGGRRYGELSGGLAGDCVTEEPPPGEEAGVDVPPPEAGITCLGSTGGLVQPCFATVPADPITLTEAIDTTSSPLCAADVTNTTACVIAGSSITIPAGATVVATGTRPLVLAATGQVTIDGTLDVASHRVGTTLGAGGNDASCDAGTPPGARGGGAGGSFAAAGGTGGNPNGGTAGAPAAAIAFRGGCPGRDGNETITNTRGIAGNGGGAVYVIAGTTLAIGAAAVINASGAGGENGISGLAGGGGGGSGGLIGLDAPAITNAGTLLANGGGGGEGSGNSTPGNPGADPTTISAAAGGANGSTNGGNGGPGGAGTPGAGGPGQAVNSGGGGGGSVGAIRVFPPQALGGLVSPPSA